ADQCLIAKDRRPGQDKNHFDIKEQENKRYHIETGIERHPGIAGWFFTAFVRGKLLRIGIIGRKQADNKEGDRHHNYAGNKKDEYLSKFRYLRNPAHGY